MRRGRGRIFEHGDLKFVVLQLLAEKPRHGYEILKALEERVGPGYTASPGTVYPTLSLLEDLGHARSQTDEGGRKVYEVTDAGRAYLEEHRGTVDGIFGRMGGWGVEGAGAAVVELGGLFAELGRVAFQHAMHGGGDAERLRRLREILERARREIESL